MKRFVIKLLLIVIRVILPFCLAVGFMVSYPDDFSGTIAGSMRYKTQLLKESEPGTVIFTGGSSSPFGVSCSEFEKKTGKKAINIGSTAYLGIDFYLSVLERYAKPGDDIILGFEWFLYTDDNINYTLMWQAIGHDIDVFRCVPLRYYRGLFSSIIDYYSLKKNHVVEDPSLLPTGWGEAGDAVFYREALLEKGFNSEDLSELNRSKIDPTIVKSINSFIKKMNERGCRVFVVFAPLDRLAVISSEEETESFGTELKSDIRAPFLNSLSDSLLDGCYFYDTNNHLTSSGSLIYTDTISERYLEYLEQQG